MLMTFYRINSSVFYPEEQTRRYVSSIKIDNVSFSRIVGLSLTNHCLDHSEILFKSVFTMLHKLFISYDFSPMDVSSANNLHKPIVSSAMSLINIMKRRGPRMDPWGTPAL